MKKILFFSLAVVMAMTMALGAHAGEKDLVFVGSDEVIEGPFYANAGAQVEMAGTINGDLVVAGGSVNVSGSVTGDVLVAGGQVTINGNVLGNVRAAGGQVTINGNIGKNISAFAGTLTLGEGSAVGGGVLAAGGMGEFRGMVQEKVTFGGGAAILAGTFGSDVDLYVGDDSDGESLIVYPSVMIDGALTYRAPEEVAVPDNAAISGGVTYNGKHMPAKKHDDNKNFAGAYVLGMIVKMFALILLGLLFTLFVPKVLSGVRDHAYTEPGKRMLVGLAWLVVTPIAALILMVTIIGIPLALITLVLYVVGLYVVKVFTAYVIGSYIVQKAKMKKVTDFWTLVMGVVVYVIVCSIPVVGWIAALLATIWMLGAVCAFKEKEITRYK